MRYAVSPFEPSELYGGAGTYVYAAPVLVDGSAVGGVALVFDSTPQFEAMLRAALPGDGRLGRRVLPAATAR